MNETENKSPETRTDNAQPRKRWETPRLNHLPVSATELGAGAVLDAEGFS